MLRRMWVLVGAALLVAGCQSGTDPVRSVSADESTAAAESAPATTTTSDPAPVATPTTTPTSTAVATVPPAAVPRLVSLTVGQAQNALRRQGLRWSVAYTVTATWPAGTVVTQSRAAGSAVTRGTVIVLMVAKAPAPRPSTPPRTTTAPPPPAPAPPPKPAGNCDPSYPDVCLHDGIGDYDCAGGSGNGPNYVAGPIRVLPPDPFGLDRDGDGVGCE